MSDGQPHPSASVPVINGPDYGRGFSVTEIGAQLTRSRLAVVVQIRPGYWPPRVLHFVVWDWKTGVKYVVSRNQIRRYLDGCKSLIL